MSVCTDLVGVKLLVCNLERLTNHIVTVNKPILTQLEKNVMPPMFNEWHMVKIENNDALKQRFKKYLCLIDLIRLFTDGVIYDSEQLLNVPPSMVINSTIKSFNHPVDKATQNSLTCGMGLSAACGDGYWHFRRELKAVLRNLQVYI